MKNLFIIAAVVALSFVGCNNKQEARGHEHSDETHQHNDAVVPASDTNSEQIEFDASHAVAHDSLVPTHDHSPSGHQR